MKKISIKTFYLIAVISIGLIGLAVGSTYAMFTTSAEISDPISLSSNLTSNDDVMETFEVEVEPYKTTTQTIIVNSGTVSNVNYGIWYLNDVTDVDIGVLSTNTNTTGTITNAGSSITSNIVLRNYGSEKKTITIGIASSKNSIVLASNMTLVPQRVLGERTINTNAATYITKLYSTTSKSTVTNNSITYNTSPSQLLINDRKGSSSTGIDAGNIRYYGASPDNYVYFNCSDYSNPTASTCELWRIIGVFDGKVKIIRPGTIGSYAWDYTNTYGSNNDWSNSTLMKLLNPGYTGTGGSLYYNAKSGTCYSGQSNATKSCDFTKTGLKNDETRNMISESNWNLGGKSGYNYYSNEYYTYERGTTVYTGRPTTWIGKVALIYLSDYGYAADFNKCSNMLNSYADASCSNNNWIKNISSIVNDVYWTLMPRSSDSSGAYDFLPYTNGNVSIGSSDGYNSFNVAPTIYLNSEVIITTGEGTEDSPYCVTYTPDSYIVTYNANGGNESNQMQSVKYEDTWTTKGKIFTKKGYTQVGWNTKADGSGTSYSLNGTQSAKKSDNITLYAVWQANTYTITYNANGGSGAPSSQTYTYKEGGNIYLSSTTPTRTGYTFLGWSLSSSATSASYSAGQWWGTHNANNCTLYAVWEKKPGPTITYSPSESRKIQSGTKLTLTCTDNSGTGMKEARIEDNGTIKTGTSTATDYLNTIRSKGTITTYFQCTDNAGNVTKKQVSYEVVACCGCCYTQKKATASTGSSAANICASSEKVCSNSQARYTNCTYSSGYINYREWYYMSC